jgi:3-deoxy-7-phosphoheptulonate synthase
VKLYEILNPNNKLGRLTMIVCMGAKKLSEKFPALVMVMWNIGHIVTYFNDPMHGNTVKAASSLKTQKFNAILVNSTILTPFSIP